MKFVVATDGSDQSQAAVEHAIDIAERLEASLAAVHAVDPNVYEERRGDPIADLPDAEQRLVIEHIEDAERRGKQILDNAASLATARGFDIQQELLYGDPVDAISRYAAENDIDGLFAGHRDKSKQHQRILGSVAKALIDRTSVPVTIVR